MRATVGTERAWEAGRPSNRDRARIAETVCAGTKTRFSVIIVLIILKVEEPRTPIGKEPWYVDASPGTNAVGGHGNRIRLGFASAAV